VLFDVAIVAAVLAAQTIGMSTEHLFSTSGT